MNKTLLEIKNLKKVFESDNKKKVEIFKDASFLLKTGELVALTGPSGSGKSTLLNMLAMFDQPTSGNIKILGKNFNTFSEKEKNEVRQSKISMIFQNNNLLSDFTAVENVLMPLLIKGEELSASKSKAKNMLKIVNLSKRENHFPSELSGGEQQRVAIARSLISNSDIILADEPTGNLDYKTSVEIFSYFLKLKKLKKGIVFATHNRELANKADYKLRIYNGNIKRISAEK